MSTAEVIKAVRTLRRNSTRTFGGNFVAVIHTDVEADLLQDTKFFEATRYAASDRLFKGEVGKYFNCVFVRAESLATFSSTVTVYPTFVIGQFAYGMTKLQGLKVIHHAPGSAGTADAMNTKRTVAWKMSFKAVIMNNNWMVRIESAAS